MDIKTDFNKDIKTDFNKDIKIDFNKFNEILNYFKDKNQEYIFINPTLNLLNINLPMPEHLPIHASKD